MGHAGDYARGMKTSEAVAYFGTQTRIADLLGITRQAVGQWGVEVPQQWQYHLERLSAGKLVPNIPLPNYALSQTEKRA